MGFRTAAGIVSTLTALGGTAAGGAHLATSHQTAPAATAVAAANTATAHTCDDGAWRGDGLNVQGRPDHFDAGDQGNTYVWHDNAGWHLSTSDATAGAHHYSGTIEPSHGATFSALHPVQLEKDDHVWVGEDGVLHYDFTTYKGIDGFDFRVSACGGDRTSETLRFHLTKNGEEDSLARIALGDGKQHPGSDPFSVHRTV